MDLDLDLNRQIHNWIMPNPELSVPSMIGIGASDYFQRHPELTTRQESSTDLTDYYFRHNR
jgi:hypothetical protein